MSNSADTDTIVAALLWDVPTLRLADDPGARQFIEVMNRRPSRATDGPVETALVRAASAIEAELRGEADVAATGYAQLAESRDYERLLGLSLQVWSSTSAEPALLDLATNEIELIESGELRARLYCKLISAALAHQWDDRLAELMERALAATPTGSRFAEALRVAAYNLGVRALELPDRPQPHAASEPLTEYAWITGLTDDADAKRLREEVTHSAQSPWTISFGLGATTTDDAITALLQADWAGAIWLRQSLQARAATHILLDRGAGPDLTASGLALWIGCGLRPIESVSAAAEHRFDHRSADLVIGQLDRGGSLRARFAPALAEAAVALWDLITDETVVELLDRFGLERSDHPALQQVPVLWATAAVRLPHEFETRFLALEPNKQGALLDALTPFTVRSLPREAAHALLQAVSSPTPQQMHIYSLLALRVGRPDLVRLDEASASAVIRLRRDSAESVEDDRLAKAVWEAANVIRSEVDDARHGRRGLGVENPWSVLALGLSLLHSEARGDGCTLLADIAIDPSLPADLRFEAVRGLTAIANHGRLPEPLPERLRQLPDDGAEAMMGDFPPDVMAAARLGLRAAIGDDIDAEAPTMVRSEEPRIRELAVEACGLAQKHRARSEIIDFALSSALFDPAERIVLKALDILTESWPESPAVSAAVEHRLQSLFDKSGRDVRARVVEVAGCWGFPGSESIVERASRDRSFQVRRVLARDIPR